MVLVTVQVLMCYELLLHNMNGHLVRRTMDGDTVA